MTYPFVPSYHDAGLRRGPIRGFCVHMAEGGGTVGYLSRANTNGVSVHYVIEYSGRTVQMLLESHMHTSIRIRNADGSSAIRQGTGTDGFGVANARAVLGDWYQTLTTLGPNHATVAVEVEGFAAAGPNSAQVEALVRLAADVRSRNAATIRGNTGHRDHNVKACPGAFIPWDRLGGHGLYATTPPDPSTGDDMALPITNPKAAEGSVTVIGGEYVNTETGVRSAAPVGETYPVVCVGTINSEQMWIAMGLNTLLGFPNASIKWTPPADSTIPPTAVVLGAGLYEVK